MRAPWEGAARVLDGTATAAAIKAELKERVGRLREAGVVPGAGLTGCRLRRLSDGTGAGAADQNTLTWKAIDTTVPHTSGTPESAQ